MRRSLTAVAAGVLLVTSQLGGVASADEVLCGPPGEEQPATIVGSGHIEGTNGPDVIVGGPGADQIFGNGGDDVICAGDGNNYVEGGTGADVLIGGESLPPFAPTNDNNDDTLNGGPGDDLIAGLSGNDILDGDKGSDELIGMGGVDNISGGPGDDTVFAGPGQDFVGGDAGADTIYGNYGPDSISGGSGADYLDGDNPFPPPGPLPFPEGLNDDVCEGEGGTDTIVNCEHVTE